MCTFSYQIIQEVKEVVNLFCYNTYLHGSSTVYLCACLHVLYICSYVCMYVCMHVCMYICKYMYERETEERGSNNANVLLQIMNLRQMKLLSQHSIKYPCLPCHYNFLHSIQRSIYITITYSNVTVKSCV